MGDTPRPPRTRRSTIGDVAALARVDRAVVSRLINGDPRLRIRDETRDRVERALRELEYQPNVAARSLRTARTHTVALLVPDYENPAYGEIIQGAERAANAVGSSLLTASMQVADESFERYIRQLGHGRVDGLLLAAGGIEGAAEEDLERLRGPWLCVNRTGPGRRRYVVLDDERAARTAVEHLVGLGHRRIALIGGPTTSDSAERRRKGYVAAMSHANLEAAPPAHSDYTAAGGSGAMHEILDRAERPTAILAANVASAIGALHAARERATRIPRDLSLIAIHDLRIAGYLDPPLTTIRMPLADMGARAVELLLTSDPDARIQEVLPGPITLIPRSSTAPPPL